MGLKKGQCGNPNGRPKGTPNKNTIIVQTFIRYLMLGNVDKFTEEFNKLSGEAYIRNFIELCKLSSGNLSSFNSNSAIISKAHEYIKEKEKES